MGQQPGRADSPAYAAHARVKKGARVEIVAQDGRLTITPLAPYAPRLDVLLKRISRKNLHAAVETGPATGNEGWARMERFQKYCGRGR
jgi:hypothetical protein